MSRRVSLSWVVSVLSIGLLVGWAAAWVNLGRAGGQTPAAPSTTDVRERMYRALEREVAEFERQGNILKTVVKLVSPTVVHVDAKKRGNLAGRPYGRRTIEEAGSGVIVVIGGAHYVITNRHVIKDAIPKEIAINLADGRQITPKKAWADPDTDVAVMAVDAPDLIPARLGDSDLVDIGDFVLAVGSPFGLSRSVTYGIISARGRRALELGEESVMLQDFLQTDAAINPGNSGGPLINLRGEVIGINTAIASNSGGSEGIGFSIPMNLVMRIANQFVERGGIAHGRLGVRLVGLAGVEEAQELGLSRPRGARLTQVEEPSPAADAKLKAGDIVVSFDGVDIENDSHLINLVGLTEVNREVPIVVFRAGKTLHLTVKVGSREVATTPASEDQPVE